MTSPSRPARNGRDARGSTHGRGTRTPRPRVIWAKLPVPGKGFEQLEFDFTAKRRTRAHIVVRPRTVEPVEPVEPEPRPARKPRAAKFLNRIPTRKPTRLTFEQKEVCAYDFEENRLTVKAIMENRGYTRAEVVNGIIDVREARSRIT